MPLIFADLFSIGHGSSIKESQNTGAPRNIIQHCRCPISSPSQWNKHEEPIRFKQTANSGGQHGAACFFGEVSQHSDPGRALSGSTAIDFFLKEPIHRKKQGLHMVILPPLWRHFIERSLWIPSTQLRNSPKFPVNLPQKAKVPTDDHVVGKPLVPP